MDHVRDAQVLTPRRCSRHVSLETLTTQGIIPHGLANQLVMLLQSARTPKVLITGMPGSGKTTLLQALVQHLPEDADLLVMERNTELSMLPPNAVRHESILNITQSSFLVIEEPWGERPIQFWQKVQASRGFIGIVNTMRPDNALTEIGAPIEHFHYVLNCNNDYRVSNLLTRHDEINTAFDEPPARTRLRKSKRNP